MFGSFHTCQAPGGRCGSSGCSAQKAPRDPYRATISPDQDANASRSRGGFPITSPRGSGLTAAQAGAPPSTGSSVRPRRAAAANSASAKTKLVGAPGVRTYQRRCARGTCAQVG